ncbi:MAG TPA: hypothetical protein VGM77_12300 [Gemmatimonadales bacterium]
MWVFINAAMISIDEARQLMNNATLSDDELGRIRDDCAALADIIIDAVIAKTAGHDASPSPAA